MWAEAAKALAEFPDVVVTAIDDTGYPVSVRQSTAAYDPVIGEVPIVWPTGFAVPDGPAVLLCHAHDEMLWKIRQFQIRGRLEWRSDGCVFVSTDFRRPPRSQLVASWTLAREMCRTGNRYLNRRGLPMPKVNFQALAKMR